MHCETAARPEIKPGNPTVAFERQRYGSQLILALLRCPLQKLVRHARSAWRDAGGGCPQGRL